MLGYSSPPLIPDIVLIIPPSVSLFPCCFSLLVADIVQEGHPEAHRPQDGHRLAGAARSTEALLQVRVRKIDLQGASYIIH